VASSDPGDLYLDLLKECLLGHVYGPQALHVPERPADPGMAEAIAELNSVGIDVTRPHVFPEEVYELGRNPLVDNPRTRQH
jgi:hypothetical protein